MYQAVHLTLRQFSRGYYNLLKKRATPVEGLANRINELLKSLACQVYVQRNRRIWISASLKHFKEVLSKLIGEENFLYLSTITAVEVQSEYEMIYHLTFAEALISVKVKVDQNNAELPTITDLIPGATLYEREIHDMFGIKISNHPDLSPLLLPDDWKENVYPLRKWWTKTRIAKAMESHEDRD